MKMFLDVRDPSIINILHNKCALVLGDYIMRILEFETYHTSDPYTHCNERQYGRSDEGDILIQPNENSLTSFYLHRTGKMSNSSYKGGTYKGLDIASNGGILIRSLLIGSNIIEGPSLIVDNLLVLYPTITMEQLEYSLRLVEYEWEDQTDKFYIGARVGLSFKDINLAYYYVSLQRSSIIVPNKHKETFYVYNLDRTDIPYRTNKHKKDYEYGKELGQLTPGLSQMQVYGFLSNVSI